MDSAQPLREVGVAFGSHNTGFQNNGNIYGNVDFNGENDSSDACLRSLAFIDSSGRCSDKESVEDSGMWIVDDEKFRGWKQNGGVLWIHGRAGCGKSMIVDTLIKRHKGTPELQLCLAFAFKSNAGALKRTAAGVYRSLLHQLLEAVPALMNGFMARSNFRKRIHTQGGAGVTWDWTLPELKENLEICFDGLFCTRNTPVWIFLDAVDNAGEGHLNDLIEHFFALCLKFTPRLSVCWTSRPYPLARAQYDFSINLAEENGQDVVALIRSKMNAFWRSNHRARALDNSDAEEVIANLAARSNGVVLWTAWMIPRIIRRIEDGEDADSIIRSMKDYPRELEEVYKEHLQSLSKSEIEIALNVFSWSCLQVRLLSVEELRHAVCLSSTPELKSMASLRNEKNKNWCPDDQVFKNRMKRISGGLFRFVQVKYENMLNRLDAEFEAFVPDHDSVADFMRNEGFEFLYSKLKPKRKDYSVGTTLVSMARDCVRALNSEEAFQYLEDWKEITEYMPSGERVGRRARPPQETPFMHYASFALCEHISEVEADDPEDCLEHFIDLFRTLRQEDWTNISRMERIDQCGWYDRQVKHTNFFHWICAHGFVKCFDFVLRISQDQSPNGKGGSQSVAELLDSVNELAETSLMLAASNGHTRIVESLLTQGARVDCVSNVPSTALLMASYEGRLEVMKLLLKYPAADVRSLYRQCGSPLYNAAGQGHLEATKLLLASTDMSAHSADSVASGPRVGDAQFTTPLIQACFMMKDGVEIVKLLLTSPTIDPDLRDRNGNTVLHGYTCFQPRLLITSGKFDVEARNHAGQTPLAYGAMTGNFRLVDELLKTRNVVIESVDRLGRTPLMLAILNTHPKIVKRLLATKKVDTHQKFAGGKSPLEVARLKSERALSQIDRAGDGRALAEAICKECVDVLRLMDEYAMQ